MTVVVFKFLCHNNNKNNKKYDQNRKDFDHEPAVGCDRLKVFQQLIMRLAHIHVNVVHIRVDAGYLLLLLLDHRRQLIEHGAQLDYSLLDRLHGIGAVLYEVDVLAEYEPLLHLLLLHQVHVEHGVRVVRLVRLVVKQHRLAHVTSRHFGRLQY